VDEFQIQADASIKQLCAGTQSGSQNNSCDFDKIDILYYRPDPNITITATNSIGQEFTFPDAIILIEASDGSQKSINIWNTGQVSVE